MNLVAESAVLSPEDTQSSLQRRAALEQVLQSRHFQKAPLLSAFLSYVCEAALQGDTGRVSEQTIGVRVFRRPEGYDPGEDNIVRNYARQLRRRLDVYYQAEGLQDAVRIDVPKGAYVALFAEHIPARTLADMPAPVLPGITETLPSPHEQIQQASSAGLGRDALEESQRSRYRRFWRMTVYALVLCGVGYGAAYFLKRSPQTPMHPLWAEIFRKDRNTVVVPADVGFVILQQLNNRTFSLAEYEGWSTVEPYDHVYTSFLKAQKYTSMTDLDIVARLQRLPEELPNRFFTRAARSLSMDDLSNDNVILLGSNFSNPWVEVFERNLTFHFVSEPQKERFWISNTKPKAGEAALYENKTRNMTHETYAVIALVPNLTKSGQVLILEGLDGPGTQAAVDLVFEGDQLSPILRKATRPDGTLGSFEVLLAATSLDTRATGVHIVAERYYPQ